MGARKQVSFLIIFFALTLSKYQNLTIMKKLIFLLAILSLASCQSSKDVPEVLAAPPEFYLGSWALTIDYDKSNAGWLEVRQEDGYLDADLLWRSGSVVPADFVFVAEGNLFVTRGEDIVRKKDAEGNPLRVHHTMSWLNIKKVDDNELFGMAFFPGRDGVKFQKVSFKGKRNPPLGEAPDMQAIQYGDPVQLIAENDLSGWKLLEEKAENGWSVENGVLENNPVHAEKKEHTQYGNLRTRDTFEDFNLTLDVKIPEGGNSGVYLKGLYEVQVYDTYGKELDSHHMGALYSRITPSVNAEKPAGEWQQLDITLYKRHLTVILNGIKIIDNQAVKGITGGAMTSDEFTPGPIYLQGDHGQVWYRNMVLTPIVE